jgi:hypothetical protein
MEAGRTWHLGPIVEDEVPCAVAERFDVAEPDVNEGQSRLVQCDPLRRVLWMFQMAEEIIREEPAALAIVP